MWDISLRGEKNSLHALRGEDVVWFRPGVKDVRVRSWPRALIHRKLKRHEDGFYRMPALLDKGNFDAWLRAEKGQELLKPANDDLLEAWPVSRRVNKTGVGDDDPTIIEKIELELPTGQLRKETSHASVLLSRNCHTSYGPRLFLDGANSRTDARPHRHSRRP